MDSNQRIFTPEEAKNMILADWQFHDQTVINGNLDMRGINIESFLNLSGGVTIEGSLILMNAVIGDLDLTGVTIRGNLDMTGANIQGDSDLTGITVDPELCLKDATFKGSLDLSDATVTGPLDLTGITIYGDLNLSGININRILIEQFRAIIIHLAAPTTPIVSTWLEFAKPKIMNG